MLLVHFEQVGFDWLSLSPHLHDVDKPLASVN